MGRQYVREGINDLASQGNKDVVAMWHPSRNTAPATSIAVTSHTKCWWQCSRGHEWEATPANMARSQRCPVCAGKRCIAGVNDLATTHAHLADQWHNTKNLPLVPQSLTYGSGRKVWWQCSQGHEWQATVDNRVNKSSGCPYCSGRKGIVGVNDLVTTHPELLAECAPDFRKTVISQGLTTGSNVKGDWICSQGHQWQAYLYSRLAGHGCPVCSNQKVLSGFNDLASQHPLVAAQWHPTKNGEVTPGEVGAGSSMYAWWLCSQDHEWRATVSNRTAGRTECPSCQSQRLASRAETEITEFVQSLGLNVVSNTRAVIAPYELDIYVPSKMVAIEFNGLYWHSEGHNNKRSSKYHYEKWNACKEQGIQLIHIWEDDWEFRKDIVKSMLTQKLQMSSSRTVHARKTEIRNVPLEELRDFLDKHHIQGFVSGSFAWGLYDSGTLVAALVAQWTDATHTECSIVRYATSAQVRGGFSRLLSHGEHVSQTRSWVTFSDNAVSDGRLYLNNGFIIDKHVPIDYHYVVGNRRVHKFNYRLARFKSDPTLIWEEGLTEKELAALNGLRRIWDAGKIKWIKRIT